MMEFTEIDSRDDILRWYVVFELLSLERSIPFFSDMGLDFSDIGSIQSVARSFVERYERRIGDETSDIILLQQTFVQLACLTDHQTAQQLYQWGQEMFSEKGATEGGALLWEVLLRRLAGLCGEGYDLASIALPEHRVDAVIQIIRHHLGDFALLMQRLENLEKLPKSDFEAKIYQEYDEDTSPLDTLLAAIGHRKFLLVWDKIKELLNNDEMELLLRWGKSQARNMDIPPDLISFPS